MRIRPLNVGFLPGGKAGSDVGFSTLGGITAQPSEPPKHQTGSAGTASKLPTQEIHTKDQRTESPEDGHLRTSRNVLHAKSTVKQEAESLKQTLKLQSTVKPRKGP